MSTSNGLIVNIDDWTGADCHCVSAICSLRI